MNVILLMIPISLLLSIGFLAVFFWATSDGQFDDLETPSHRILDQDHFYKQKNKSTGDHNT